MEKEIVIDVSDGLKDQNFAICLSAVPPGAQYVEKVYI